MACSGHVAGDPTVVPHTEINRVASEAETVGNVDFVGRLACTHAGNGLHGQSCVTLRHLLTHTAGLPPFKTWHKEASSVDEYIQRIAPLPLDPAPGEQRVYSDLGFIMLGRIVEIADWLTIYEDPKHPYSQALLSAIPIPDPAIEAKRKRIILEGYD